MERTFEGTKKGEAFKVTTSLTDQQAIDALREMAPDGVGFAHDCATNIALMVKFRESGVPQKIKTNLVAWGFRMAEEKINRVAVTLHTRYRKGVACRHPFKGEVAGERVAIKMGGDNSKHKGKYIIGNDEPFGSPFAKFYGFADPNGAWTPTRACPPALVEALCNGK